MSSISTDVTAWPPWLAGGADAVKLKLKSPFTFTALVCTPFTSNCLLMVKSSHTGAVTLSLEASLRWGSLSGSTAPSKLLITARTRNWVVAPLGQVLGT